MNQEERRQRRQKDTKSAVIVCVIVMLILLVLVAGGVFLVGRLLPKGGGQNEGTDGTELPGENVVATEEVTEQPQTEVQTDPVEEQAAQLVSQMTLEDKIAQMFVITPNALTGYASGVTAAGDTTKEAYQSRPVGGIVYMADNLTDPEQTTTMLSNMQEIARERTGLPVFLCVDEEGGSVARIAGNDAFGVTDVGNMSDIGASGDVQNAYNAGSTIGSYLAALGFNVDFAPVADVLTNPDNQVIGQRSFGSDAQTVAGMVTSELQGLSAAGVYGMVKHFPGHGGTSGDSHDGAVSTDKTLEELMAEELVPFQSAIDGGVNFVMVGHISAPNVTGDNAPATLSKVLITDVLRGQMGYNGIVITDAMNMEAITGFYNSDKAAVLAVTAGADMILMPADYNTAYTGILNAVNDGTITEERINESVTRIVKAKLAMGQP
jgi:beta-N-acetylhexosaminidase